MDMVVPIDVKILLKRAYAAALPTKPGQHFLVQV